MNDLQPILAALSHKFLWLPVVIGVARLLMKWFSGPLQQKLMARMVAAATGPDAEEERDWEAILGMRWYRVLNFSLDLVLSIKLPTLADFLRAQVAHGEKGKELGAGTEGAKN